MQELDDRDELVCCKRLMRTRRKPTTACLSTATVR